MLLMLDNYDSFTYNIVQYFGELGQEVKVFRNDAITLAEIAKLEKREAVTVTHWEYRELAPGLLLAVFLLLALDAVLGMTVLRTLP